MTHETLDPTLPIFQLKITLNDIEPAIWRRIQTHDCSLAELHDIVQACMDWEDYHMHAFEIGGAQFTDLGLGGDLRAFRDSRSVRLSDLVERGRTRFVYEYDFGDSWRNAIEIEKTLPPEEGVRYPRCIDGRRASPPEDCGGPFAYSDLLYALENPDEEKYDERMEWIEDDYDPERFSAADVNRELLLLREWLGQHPRLHDQTALFAVGDRIRARRGTVHPEYADIPLGGWIGTVTRIAWLIPISYEIQWTEETLDAAHPVYSKRCERDAEEPEVSWLDEWEIEPDSADAPVEMEQPANLVVRPLSEDDQEDRIRMVFGLTSDDALPAMSDETERQYLDYLQAHLKFPFNASYCSDQTDFYENARHGEVVGFASPSPIDVIYGIMCEVRRGQETDVVPLENLELDDDDPNCRYLDDYEYWLDEISGFDDEDDDEDEDEDEEDEEYDEYDDQDLLRSFARRRSMDVKYYAQDDLDLGPEMIASDSGSGYSEPQPIRREQALVGRNDPCPCGSGKKFKKCCLKKQGEGFAE